MSRDRTPSLLPSMLFTAMAGGMGWGIRGQYGHGTGAMIAGVLVGLMLVLIFARQAGSRYGLAPRHCSRWGSLWAVP